jgi:hypothetical protein
MPSPLMADFPGVPHFHFMPAPAPMKMPSFAYPLMMPMHRPPVLQVPKLPKLPPLEPQVKTMVPSVLAHAVVPVILPEEQQTKSRAFTPGPDEKSHRQRASPYQRSMLEQVMTFTCFPSTRLRKKLAELLGMNPRSVQIWFQNRRQKLQIKKSMNRRRSGSPASQSSSSSSSSSFSQSTTRFVPYAYPDGTPRRRMSEHTVTAIDFSACTSMNEVLALLAEPCSDKVEQQKKPESTPEFQQNALEVLASVALAH